MHIKCICFRPHILSDVSGDQIDRQELTTQYSTSDIKEPEIKTHKKQGNYCSYFDSNDD